MPIQIPSELHSTDNNNFLNLINQKKLKKVKLEKQKKQKNNKKLEKQKEEEEQIKKLIEQQLPQKYKFLNLKKFIF